MIFCSLKHLVLLGVTFLAISALIACSNSDDYLFNNQDLPEITVTGLVVKGAGIRG